MKIRSITLDNVRRFTDPVTVGPIGDGITLLCQPNESGKSTLFDALHALFYVKYSGWRAEVASLQPHSGGKVAVTVELEIDGENWRVRKQWQRGAGGEARVWRDGQLRHQGDDAEHWLSGIVRGDGTGPSGLLWVRQGRVSLSVDGKYAKGDEKGEEHEQRRNLLTLITGAMDDLTGGKTMDAARDTCAAELGQLQTAGGKPKAGGAWAQAQAQVERLEETEAHLARQADELHEALEERRRLRAQLVDLQDDETRAAHARDLASAEAAFKDAERHASLVSQAATEAALARQTESAARAEAEAVQARRDELKEAGKIAETAAEAAETTAGRLAGAEAAWQAAQQGLKAAEAEDARARTTLQRVTRRDAALAAAEQRRKMANMLEKAEDADRRAAEALAEAERGPKEDAVDRIESLARAVETARAVRDASGPRVAVSYLPGAPEVRLDGAPLADGATRVVTGRATFDLPGIGALTVTPQEDGTVDPVQTAEAALARALETAGYERFAALRAAARARAEALRAAHLAAEARDTLAPEGLQALRNELARLPVPEDMEDEKLPDPDAARQAAQEAGDALASAREAEAGARTRRDAAKDPATAARTNAAAAAERLDRARHAMRDLPEREDAALAERLDRLRAAAEAAEALHLERQEAAPNVQAAEAKLKRIRSVIREAETQAQAVQLRLAELRALIQARAEEGVEEALEDARLRLDSARERLERVSFEVEVLRRLNTALEAAQSAARDEYYAPIMRELRPLLEELWDDAELIWSDDTLLPSGMVRKGESEPIDTLSGGTQEQIAFLVRLAFARLLAKAGRHAPLILDDALVYSDDDRIERLFNALHGAAGDLQIIVLSCRQRAFRELGAPQVAFRPADEGAEG